jgi:hypothetical protein
MVDGGFDLVLLDFSVSAKGRQNVGKVYGTLSAHSAICAGIRGAR